MRAQSGELPILRDESEQGGLAARSSQRRTTPRPLWTPASWATPRPKHKPYHTELLDAGAARGSRGVPEQVCYWTLTRPTVRRKTAWMLFESHLHSQENSLQCFAFSSNFTACTWEQDLCVARKPGAEEAERPGSNSQPEPLGGASEQSHNGTRPKRCSHETPNQAVLIMLLQKSLCEGNI